VVEAIRRVGKKAQITLPRKIIKKLSITEGDRLLVRLEGEDIVITPIIPMRRSAVLTKEDLDEAIAQADREFSNGSAKIHEDAAEMFREAGWVEEKDG